MSTGEILLALPLPIDLALTVASHGWAYLAPWIWDPENGVLARRERIDGDIGEVAAEQRDPTTIVIRYRGFPASAEFRNHQSCASLAVGGLGPGRSDRRAW